MYGRAVLDHVQDGTYPESEDVISANLPTSALPEVLKLIRQARDDIKAKIRENSKSSAPDIDGWILQAKQLRFDIEKSQKVARDIVEQARQDDLLKEKLKDTANKTRLLEGEVAFNKTLGAILQRLQVIRQKLDVAQRATLDDQLQEAVELIEELEGENASLSLSQNARVASLFGARITDLREHVIEKLAQSWKSLFRVDALRCSIRINHHSTKSSSLGTTSLVDAMIKLNMFEVAVLQLCNDFETSILTPRLRISANGTICPLHIGGGEISTSGSTADLSAQALFRDIDSIIEFLRSQLPAIIVEVLIKSLIPRLISRLLSTWLASAVPEGLDGFEDFEDTMSLVKHLALKLNSWKWPGKRELRDWAQGIPNIWIRKQRETSLERVRHLLSQGIVNTETVERVETQRLSKEDPVLSTNAGGDDWDARWSDEEANSPTKPTSKSELETVAVSEDEEDVSAWGLDDEKADVDAPEGKNHEAATDDEAEAWGWGDDNEDDDSCKPSHSTRISPKKATSNGISSPAPQTERELTLKETYNISSLPREILAIISQMISDAERLETAEFADSPITSAAGDLLGLPGLIVAMYRAGASTSYSRHPSGPMFLYNDSLWLTERLQKLVFDHTTSSGRQIRSRIAHNLKLDTHILALETFGKRAYAKEMESQRTIITDLLDGAQGFANCTEHPFNQECDIAVASTIDRLRDLNRQWRGVLSHSALLQSLGSLLSTITNKIIVDIEDMADISEPDSQQLTIYCNRIAALEDLFLPAAESGPTDQKEGTAPPIPLTALYAPHWLKFQYLANILESSLVDIKYLWTEGELGLEFDTEELVDLIRALFADTPHSRSAVAEIRGRRGVR